MVNKHAGLIILCVLSLQSTLSDDSTSPKKSFLIMKALFEVESNSKGITFFPLKLQCFCCCFNDFIALFLAVQGLQLLHGLLSSCSKRATLQLQYVGELTRILSLRKFPSIKYGITTLQDKQQTHKPFITSFVKQKVMEIMFLNDFQTSTASGQIK